MTSRKDVVVKPLLDIAKMPLVYRPKNFHHIITKHIGQMLNMHKNCQKIVTDIENIIISSKRYDHVVFPMDGFGTGLSMLKEKSPNTLKFLDGFINSCLGIDHDPDVKK